MEEIYYQLGFIKLNFCSAENKVKKTKRPDIDQEKIFTKTHLIKDCFLTYIKNS